jgi:hypothetical protein
MVTGIDNDLFAIDTYIYTENFMIPNLRARNDIFVLMSIFLIFTFETLI